MISELVENDFEISHSSLPLGVSVERLSSSPSMNLLDAGGRDTQDGDAVSDERPIPSPALGFAISACDRVWNPQDMQHESQYMQGKRYAPNAHLRVDNWNEGIC